MDGDEEVVGLSEVCIGHMVVFCLFWVELHDASIERVAGYQLGTRHQKECC